MPKLYIRKLNSWLLFDNTPRETAKDFESKRGKDYGMVYDTIRNKSYEQGSSETNILPTDIEATLVTTIDEYFKIANTIKNNGLYLYNKKLGKAVLKR